MLSAEGYISAFSVGNGRLTFQHKASILPTFDAVTTFEHRDYSDWRLGILQGFVSAQSFDESQDKVGAKPYIHTYTAFHDVFGKVREHLYDTNGEKVLDGYILQFVDWEFLAILFQEVGYVDMDSYVDVDSGYDGGKHPIYLDTGEYSEEDNAELAEVICAATKLPFGVRRVKLHNGSSNWRLRLPPEYYRGFKKGVLPYILPSFKCKLV